MPRAVDDSPWTNGVSDIVCTVRERRCAGSENLHEGVGVLDLIGVFLGMCIHALHAFAFRGPGDSGLSSVYVVVETVESTHDHHGWDTLERDLHVVQLVDAAFAHGVVVQRSHSPAKRTTLLQELGVEFALSKSYGFTVVVLVGFDSCDSLLIYLHGGGGACSCDLVLADFRIADELLRARD